MNIIEKARDLLVKQDITNFKLDIVKMKFSQTVIFDTFQSYAKRTGMSIKSFEKIKDGCTIIRDNTYLILTHEPAVNTLHRTSRRDNDVTADKRIRWTLAHEVGHVVLGHVKDDYEEERQANIFATELLMPELAILELKYRLRLKGNSLTSREISRLFGVSQSAAENRLSQIEYKSFFSAYLKRDIMAQYRKLIDDYVEKRREKICQKVTI